MHGFLVIPIHNSSYASLFLTRVTVSAISFEGTECRLIEISRVVQATGGEVSASIELPLYIIVAEKVAFPFRILQSGFAHCGFRKADSHIAHFPKRIRW